MDIVDISQRTTVIATASRHESIEWCRRIVLFLIVLSGGEENTEYVGDIRPRVSIILRHNKTKAFVLVLFHAIRDYDTLSILFIHLLLCGVVRQ